MKKQIKTKLNIASYIIVTAIILVGYWPDTKSMYSAPDEESYHIVMLRFSSAETMQSYIGHADQVELAEIGTTIVERFSAFDYRD
jgi:hypothetical protein